jgi:hypothetical protein
MKKGLMLVVLLFTVLVLAGCGERIAQGDEPLDTEAALRLVQTGTQGVEIELQTNLPPSLVYDDSELIALVEVHNRGNYNLDAHECFVQITGFDPNIIRGDFGRAASCTENYGVLEGKNVYNVEGSTNQIEFRAPSVTLPNGVFEYEPKLNYLACYQYHTIANPEVCVDPLFYQVTAEQKACTPTNVPMAGGQGAPVGISYVGVDMVGSKAVFEINVKNFNPAGRVLSPYADVRACGQASLNYQDLDRVGYNVQLTGAGYVDCKPTDGLVRLVNDQGKIVCTFDIPGSAAYTTPLLIDLDYGFIDSFSKPVKIVQTPS